MYTHQNEMTAAGPSLTLLDVRARGIGIYLICFGLSLAIYWPALHGEFIMDDWGYITQNAAVVNAPSPLKYWITFDTTDYWPLTYTLYWLEYRIFGENPVGYHLVNIVLHSLNGFLLYLLALRIGLGWALGAALLFLLHPLHVQATAWIAQSKTLLATFFVLVTLHLYHSGRRHLAILSFALSLLAKTSALFLPLALLVLDRPKTWRDGLKHLPFFMLAAAGGLTTLYVNSLHFHDTAFPIFQMPWYERLLIVPQNLVFYLNKFVLPYPLAYLYPPPTAAIWGLMIFWLGCFCWLRHRFVAVFLLLLAPGLGLVTIPNMKLSLVADHWAYLPNLFACLFVAEALLRVRKPAIAKMVWVVILAGSGILATRHARSFATETGFWRQAVQVHPDSAPAAYNLGVAHDKKSEMSEATAHYKRAVEIDPQHARAWNNLGRAYFLANNLADAEMSFEKALLANPRLTVAYISLAKVYSLLLQKDQSRAILERGLATNPGDTGLLKALEDFK